MPYLQKLTWHNLLLLIFISFGLHCKQTVTMVLLVSQSKNDGIEISKIVILVIS